MDKDEALELLKAGQSARWNKYRKNNPNWNPDFEGEDLTQIDFAPPGKPVFDMTNANFVGCKLPGIRLLLPREIFINDSSGSVQGQISLDPGIVLNIEDARLLAMAMKMPVETLLVHLLRHLFGALIDQTTTIEDNTDLERFEQLGLRFVTREELKRVRAAIPLKLFISYAWADEKVVLAIDQWLTQKGLVTRIDRRDFFAGEKIREEIMRVMSDTDAILLFHSERTANKPWIEFERKLARKFKGAANQEKKLPPQVILVVLDDTPLPDTEKDRIAIMAKGKKFPQVCQEIYDSVLRIPRMSYDIEDVRKWDEFVF